MKLTSILVKYVIVPISTMIGLLYSFDMYVVNRAATVVEPVKVKVYSMDEGQKIHQDRVERELLMIRSNQDDMNRFLREKRN